MALGLQAEVGLAGFTQINSPCSRDIQPSGWAAQVRQAREIGLDRDSALQAEMTTYRDQLARPYFTDQAIMDDIVRDLYQKQQEEINAEHLLVLVDEGAAPADTLAAYQKIVAFRDSIDAGMAFDEAAFRTLWVGVVTALRIISPVMPFLTEHLWSNLVAGPGNRTELSLADLRKHDFLLKFLRLSQQKPTGLRHPLDDQAIGNDRKRRVQIV